MEIYQIDNKLKIVSSKKDNSYEVIFTIAKHLADKLCGNDKNANFYNIVKDIYSKIVSREVKVVLSVINSTSGVTYYVDVQKSIDNYIEMKIKSF